MNCPSFYSIDGWKSPRCDTPLQDHREPLQPGPTVWLWMICIDWKLVPDVLLSPLCILPNVDEGLVSIPKHPLIHQYTYNIIHIIIDLIVTTIWDGGFKFWFCSQNMSLSYDTLDICLRISHKGWTSHDNNYQGCLHLALSNYFLII